MAAQVAIAIENARLYQAIKRQEQQLERDIAMAREVQLRLLPTTPPVHKHAEFAVSFLPARAIGGDLYDFLEYGPDQTAIVLGDVSGKAAPAALFAALVSGIMRSAAQQKPAPAEMLSLLNESLQERRLESQYVVMLFALWNDENQTLQVANSGAFPLGMFPTATYEEFNMATQPGDAIVFVSDGILDAENEKGEMYGEERLSHLLCGHRDLPAQHIASAILADVTHFQGAQDRFDDETIIVLRVK
jgi:sigma-B regulation protein RsbU (phosphoserine phosphatase)